MVSALQRIRVRASSDCFVIKRRGQTARCAPIDRRTARLIRKLIGNFRVYRFIRREHRDVTRQFKGMGGGRIRAFATTYRLIYLRGKLSASSVPEFIRFRCPPRESS